MGVASRHWPQSNASRPHQICLISFILVWSVTVYAGSNDTVSNLCYIHDTGCDACKKCVNSVKDECACVLLSDDNATCDVQCMDGRWNRDRVTDWPELGMTLFASAALIVFGFQSFTLWYWWKHGTSVNGPSSTIKSESSEVTTTGTHECVITTTTVVVTTAENTIALVDPCCQPESEGKETDTTAAVSVESCVDTGSFVATLIAETAPEGNSTSSGISSSHGTSSPGTLPETPPLAEVPENV